MPPLRREMCIICLEMNAEWKCYTCTARYCRLCALNLMFVGKTRCAQCRQPMIAKNGLVIQHYYYKCRCGGERTYTFRRICTGGNLSPYDAYLATCGRPIHHYELTIKETVVKTVAYGLTGAPHRLDVQLASDYCFSWGDGPNEPRKLYGCYHDGTLRYCDEDGIEQSWERNAPRWDLLWIRKKPVPSPKID